MTYEETATRPRRRYEHVVDQLLELLHDDELAAGAALPPERVLATRFDVSRTAVREALRVLEQRGILVARHGAGHFVRHLPTGSAAPGGPAELETASIADILEVRTFLEQQVAMLACQRRTRAEAAELARLAEQHGAWEDNLRFHTALAAATHNFMLEQLVQQQLDLLEQLHQRDHYADADVAKALLAEHRDLAAAVMARDEEWATALVRQHLRHTRQGLSETLRTPTDLR